MPAAFVATLVDGEVVLRFPYDDRLRLLAALDSGAALGSRGAGLAGAARPRPGARADRPVRKRAVSGRRLRRARPRTRAPARQALAGRGCWSISPGPTATGGSASRPTARSDLVDMLLEHPAAYRVPAIERGLLPVDRRGRRDPARVLRARLQAAPHRRCPSRPDRGRARTGRPSRAVGRGRPSATSSCGATAGAATGS